MANYPGSGFPNEFDQHQFITPLGFSQPRISPVVNPEEKGLENPPPLPQRNTQQPYTNFAPYGGGYNSYYGGGNPYQNHLYGNTGGMFQNFGSPMYQNNNSVTSGLENASQNAFQSAQSFIGAFSSISMMLESTLFAVQNSVRAIAGVADQFGHLRHYLLSSAASFYRLVNYYYKKILCVLRLKQPDTQDERFWQDAMSGRSGTEESRLYASLLFFSLVIATPWFIWKLLKSINSKQKQEEKWFEGSGEHFVAEVKFPFVARSRDEMNLSKNTIVRLAPKARQPNIKGWLLASDGENQGLVPANYIKVLGKNRKESTLPTTQTKSHDLVDNKPNVSNDDFNDIYENNEEPNNTEKG